MGYIDSLLRVNLTSGEINKEGLNRKWADLYYGGKGLGIKYLYEELKPGTDPLSDGNKIILLTGPFTGTIVPCSGKLSVVTKSPVNGAALDCSVGGSIAGELKYAGYDMVILEGKAPKPVYLVIEDGEVKLQDAGLLWGKGTIDTEKELLKLHGEGTRVLSIGPAGENMVTYACLTSELYRQAGRGGAGAVFGSKNLKAVVVRGTGGVSVADMKGLLKAAHKAMREDLLTDTNLWAYTDGTPMLVEMSQNSGILPTRNFQQATFEGFESLTSPSMQKARAGKKACLSCGLGCGNYTVKGSARVEGPEYETLSIGGSNCGIADLEAVVKFNALCDDLGLDTISMGSTIAFAMEMTEKGIKDFGLRFGDVTTYLKVPELVAFRKDMGLELALGVRTLSERYGGEEFAMQVKGLEFPGYEPRGSWAMGLAYATAPRGACHMSAWPVAEEAYGERDPYTVEGKAGLVADLQHYNALKFSLILCDFWALSFDLMAEMLIPVLGREVTAAELELVGERIFNLARLFNAREGFTGKDDILPDRIFTQGLVGGPGEGKTLPREEFTKMLGEYYSLRGWDANGIPEKETLARLELT